MTAGEKMVTIAMVALYKNSTQSIFTSKQPPTWVEAVS